MTPDRELLGRSRGPLAGEPVEPRSDRNTARRPEPWLDLDLGWTRPARSASRSVSEPSRSGAPSVRLRSSPFLRVEPVNSVASDYSISTSDSISPRSLPRDYSKSADTAPHDSRTINSTSSRMSLAASPWRATRSSIALNAASPIWRDGWRSVVSGTGSSAAKLDVVDPDQPDVLRNRVPEPDQRLHQPAPRCGRWRRRWRRDGQTPSTDGQRRCRPDRAGGRGRDRPGTPAA